nr:FAD-binding protein [Candidatus Paceibacterota bacterium]
MEQSRPLKEETTFGIGGPAERYVVAVTEDEVRDALAQAAMTRKKVTILAGGSNVLIADDGIEGVTLHMRGGTWKVKGTTLHVQAGVSLTAVIREMAAQGIGGWEDLSGIPGTVGGAIRGNAGAFGTEIAKVLKEVRALDVETGHLRSFSAAQCRFTYRHSFFKTHPQWLLLDAVFTLNVVDSKSAVERIDKTLMERERRHLQNVRAAGSFFMNPTAESSVI